MRRAVVAAMSLFIFTTGCWDKVEIEDRGMITSLGIDKSGAGYSITISMPGIMKTDVNPLDDAAKIVITAEGDSLDDALKVLNEETNRKLYLGQTKAVALGKDVLTDLGMLKDTIKSLENNRDVSRQIFVLACKTSEAKEVLSLDLDGMPALGILSESYYTNNPERAKGARTLEDMIACLYKGGEIKIATIQSRVKDKEKSTGEIIFGEAEEL
ncbi:MAG: hypothetical protein LBL96_04015 [Clostridiales bacterium]|jgi:spore germination protein KC|nr:hypothetical protein [Clostridiales bacterium]